MMFPKVVLDFISVRIYVSVYDVEPENGKDISFYQQKVNTKLQYYLEMESWGIGSSNISLICHDEM